MSAHDLDQLPVSDAETRQRFHASPFEICGAVSGTGWGFSLRLVLFDHCPNASASDGQKDERLGIFEQSDTVSDIEEHWT
jgi:hypothetical protein